MTALRRIARLEHRLTRPNASLNELDAACALALHHQLSSVAVSPWLVKPAARLLARSRVRLTAVIGYPHGGQLSAVKAFEAAKAIENGATQLDFVLNAGALISGDDQATLDDMQAVIEMAHSAMAVAGVIIQAAPLDEELLRRACRLAARAGADYVVTSPGEEQAAGTIDLAGFLHRAVGEHLEVKAAGLFTDLDQIARAVDSGAGQVSTSFSPALAAEATAWLAAARSPSPSLADVAAAAG